MQRAGVALLGSALIALTGLWLATAFIADVFRRRGPARPRRWDRSPPCRAGKCSNAEDDDEDSLAQSVGDAAASEAARTSGRFVDRELSVRPTLRIHAGGSVRLLVTRDIVFR